MTTVMVNIDITKELQLFCERFHLPRFTHVHNAITTLSITGGNTNIVHKAHAQVYQSIIDCLSEDWDLIELGTEAAARLDWLIEVFKTGLAEEKRIEEIFFELDVLDVNNKENYIL